MTTQQKSEAIDDASLPLLSIPSRIRSFVYLVGMIGFPVVVAIYVLVVLATDLKQIDKSLNGLSNRIAERPMGVERSTDFIIYLTEGLKHELRSGLPDLVARLDLAVASPDNRAEVKRKVTIIHREIDAYMRPIVRKHQRFAERFPTVGGNLGSLFVLSAPSESLNRGETEAHLRGETSKNFAEALSAMWMNNIANFGQVGADGEDSDDEGKAATALEKILGIDKKKGAPAQGALTKKGELVDRTLFLKLALDGTDTATTVLRDQMLQKLKLNATVRE